MDEKPFLTFNSQMKYLRTKKKIDCNGSDHKKYLVTYGYFNLINAYKSPFVVGNDINGDHIYIGGTSIDHFVYVKQFDDSLRILLLQTLTRIEEEIRNLVSYKLDQSNNKAVEWYDVQAYSSKKDTQDIIRVISKCFYTIDEMEQDYVDHYTKKYGKVPTWIFTKVIKFSELIDVISISKYEVLDSLCKLYGIVDNVGKYKHALLISMLHTIRSVRNSCAHNERVIFYCKENNRINLPFKKYMISPNRYTKDRNIVLVDLIVFLKYFLDNSDYSIFISNLIDLLRTLEHKINSSAFDSIRGSLGIKKIEDLEYLRNSNKKKINYNKF